MPGIEATSSSLRPIRTSVAGTYPLVTNAVRALVERLPGVELVPGPDSIAEALSGWGQSEDSADLLLLVMPQPEDLERMTLSRARGVAAGDALLPRLVFVSPTWTADGVMAALNAGATGYLSAGLMEAGLAAALRQAVTGEITLSPEITRDVIAQLAARPQSDAMSSLTSAGVVTPAEPARDTSHRPPLSEREMQVLSMVCDGLSNKEIAQRLYLSLRTVENHLASVYARLGVRSRTEAAVLAVRNGWTTDASVAAEPSSTTA